MDKTRVSVIIPAYNGGKYLSHQIDSILPMLKEHDEIVISVDKSTDNTLEIAKGYRSRDNRIKVFLNNGERGVWSNSINGLRHAKGKFVFPCDQDDEWINNKIDVIMRDFENNEILAVVHDGFVCDAELNVIGDTISNRLSTNDSLFKNFRHNTISGCCYAFRRELINVLLDTPLTPDAADQWSGITAIILGKLEIDKNILIKHRIHENNYTPKVKRKMSKRIYGRICLLINVVWLILNKRKYKKDILHID